MLCSGVVRCVPIETHLQDKDHLLLQTEICVLEYKHYYRTSVNMLILDDIINKLELDVHKLWKCQSGQFKLLESALEGHLLLLQLNSSHHIMRV